MTLAAEPFRLIEPSAPARAVFSTRTAPRERTLLDILGDTARRYPHAPALDADGVTLSCRKMLQRVTEIAARLQSVGIGPGDRVGIRLPSGTADLYLGILATLAAGAAYVPIDFDDPDERARVVLDEADAVVVLDGSLQPKILTAPGGRPRGVRPEDDAWVIFTSGSTGTPKGVAVSHRSAAAFVDAEAELFLPDEPIRPGDRVLAGLSVAFDASCEEMWLAWRHGACLVPAPRSLVRSGVDLGPWLVEQRITVVSTVPTLAALWPASALDEVRLLIFGGEACPAELAERLAVEGREVWNTYGPTEATVVACAAQLTGVGEVRIGLPLAGWQLAVVDEHGEPVGPGESGELVIGGVGVARYLDPLKDAEKFGPLLALGWERAYRSGDLVRADPEGLVFLGRADEQVKLGGRRIELGEIDAAVQALPGVAGGAVAIRTTKAGNQILVGYVVPRHGDFDHPAAIDLLRAQLPAALVPLLVAVESLPTKTSGKVDRAALPWPLPESSAGVDPMIAEFSETERWLAELWADILGVAVTDAEDDFFAHGGGSLTAAQLIARIRERHSGVSVTDVYRRPTLGALAAAVDESTTTTSAQHRVRPTPTRAGIVQALAMIPLLTVIGMRWIVGLAVVGNLAVAFGTHPWLPTASWWWIALGVAVFFTPAGRIAVAAAGARLLLRDVRPGSYPRGGSVHLRLWAAEKLAEVTGAASVSGASWMTHYAKALGARIGADVDLHSPPPVTGMLRVGRGAAIEPEVDLRGYWVDGDQVHIGKVRVGAGARVGARSILLPGARVGKRAEVAAGSCIGDAVAPGIRVAGSPAVRAGKPERKWPSSRPPRSHVWSTIYGATSLVVGMLPVVAMAAAVVVLLTMTSDAESVSAALPVVMTGVPIAALVYLLGYAALVLLLVRLLSIGIHPGYHPLHSGVAWRVWATERLMDLARNGLFPLYASLFTPVWLRLLGAKVGRGTEVSTVLAVPKMTTVADGAFLADDTMVATYELGNGWLHVAEARIGKQAFLGNSGMTAAGRSVPNRGLVGVLSATPKKAKKGSSWLGMPPMPLPRTVEGMDTSRTFDPPAHLKWARGLVESCRVLPVIASFALGALTMSALTAVWSVLGWWPAVLLSGVIVAIAGVAACVLTTAAKWLLVGRFGAHTRPLWSSFVWRNELADTFVEALAVPWLVGRLSGTPLLSGWLRTMGARIGRGVWLESYWLPEYDLVSLGDGATVNRGCVLQTHLFHDRIMSMDSVRLAAGATVGPHGVVLPGASIGAHTTVGPASLVTRGDAVPAESRWHGNPIAAWEPGKSRRP